MGLRTVSAMGSTGRSSEGPGAHLGAQSKRYLACSPYFPKGHGLSDVHGMIPDERRGIVWILTG